MNSPDTASGGASFPAKAGVICALVFLFALLCGFLPASTAPANATVVPGAARFYDSTRQIRFHRGLLIATAAVAVAMIRARGRTPLLDGAVGAARSGRAIWGAVARMTPAVIFLVALVEYPKLKWSIVGAASTVGFVWLGSRHNERSWFKRSLAITFVLCAAAMIIPGFALTPDLSLGASVPVAVTEIHYSISVSQGDRLSQGGHLFTSVMPHYGILEPFVLALVQKARGLLDFGTHIRIVQAMQVVFSLAAFLCYWLWSRRRLLPTAFGFLPILAYVHTLHISVFCPNQSGWRFAGLPLGLLALISLRRSNKSATTLLGCVLGALLLFNPETGIVIGAAYTTYIVSGCLRSGEGTGGVIRSLLRFSLGAVLVLVAFVFLFRISLGYYPFPSTGGSSYTLARFAGGYGGEKIYFSMSWIVILTLSLFEIVRSSLSFQALTSRRRLRLSIAVAILVWFAYFANRPTGWNLWTYWFLFGFFVIDLVRPVYLRRLWHSLRRGRVTMGFALIGLFAANGSFMILPGFRDIFRSLGSDHRDPATVLSGVWLSEAHAAAVRQRAEYVRARSKDVSLVYFSSSPYLMPLVSGVVCDLPFSDPYVEGFTMGDFEMAVAWIEARRPTELLFDDGAVGPAGFNDRNAFMARLKGRLSSTYRPSGNASGWEVWKVRVTAARAVGPDILPLAEDHRSG